MKSLHFCITYLLASQSLACLDPTAGLAAETPKPQRPGGAIEKAFVSFRLGVNRWYLPETRYEQLLELFEKHKGVADELTFFTSATHPPVPLEEMRRRAEILRGRMAQARALGYRAGINVLATIGHHEENLPHSLDGDYTRVTDINGAVSRGTFCPNDPRFQEYVRELYRIVVSADPDYIWLDDDIRLAGHMPVGQTCYCDRCLEIFGDACGTKYTRASLREAFANGTLEQRLALRKAWLAHNRATIGRLLQLIERTVHEAKPGLPLGFMTGDRFYEGYDFDRWAETLAGPERSAVYWRPGGGFYEDSWTAGLAGKSHDIGRQVSVLPPWVLSIQSEIENFPYQRLKKSAHITVLEAASHMAAGCTGAAFNVLSGYDEPLDEFEPMVARIRKARPFFDLLARHLGRAQPLGVWAAWNKDTFAAMDLVGGDYQAPQIWEIGLPAAYAPQGAAVTLLFSQSALALSKEEITQVLSSGVYTDADTLELLNRMGFGELTGLAPGPPIANDCIEILTDHSLNGPFSGRLRDCRQSFYHIPARGIEKTDPKAEILARLIDYAGEEKASASLAIFENRLGGRISVSGYFPWVSVHSLPKSSEMKSLFRWLSRDRLPAYVASYHKVNLWVRRKASGGLAIVLINASFDPAVELALAVLTECERAKAIDMDLSERTLERTARDGPYSRFVIPLVEPWSARLVLLER